MTARPDILSWSWTHERVDRLSAYGFPEEISPHLDALAADAARFRHDISTAQWTIPSHTSMFTGVYPAVHPHPEILIARAAAPTLAERLQQGGYYTAAFCNNPLVGVVDNGLRRGYYSFLNYSGLLTSRPNQAGARSRLTGRYRQFLSATSRSGCRRLRDSFARSDALLEFAFTPLMVPLWPIRSASRAIRVKSLNDAARLLVERKNVAQKQPIFAFVNVMGTHMPFHPNRDYIERFAPDFLGDKAAQRWRFNSDVLGWLTPWATTWTNAAAHHQRHVQRRSRYPRRSAWRLLRTAAHQRRAGPHPCDHRGGSRRPPGRKDFVGHSISLYNELTHVPLIIRDPNGDLRRRHRGSPGLHPAAIPHALACAGLADAARALFARPRRGPRPRRRLRRGHYR